MLESKGWRLLFIWNVKHKFHDIMHVCWYCLKFTSLFHILITGSISVFRHIFARSIFFSSISVFVGTNVHHDYSCKYLWNSWAFVLEHSEEFIIHQFIQFWGKLCDNLLDMLFVCRNFNLLIILQFSSWKISDAS